MSALASLSPTSVWSHFDALTRCPRPSGEEAAAIAYVREVADARGWTVTADARGNLFVDVPATAGRESAPVVMLQAHLDMVCEKNSDIEFDFSKDPIRTRVDGEWVAADGTTLGADNGIGVAAALAAGDGGERPHGPLRLVFTLDEETGLTGAAQLDGSLLTGDLLLNLDSEEDGALCIGCAGGADAHIRLPLERTAPSEGWTWVRLRVCGLKGGHSGINIHENRGNAVRLVVRCLRRFAAGGPWALAELGGGGKHNAIPREADAVLGFPTERESAWRDVVDGCRVAFAGELPPIESGFALESEPAERPDRVVVDRDAAKLLQLVTALPHGVLAMSHDVPGLVETSNNVAIVALDADGARIVTSARSNIDSKKLAVLDAQRALAEALGAEVELHDGYPGWQPDLDSRTLAAAREAYREVWGREPEVGAIHAGLECGLLGERKPGLDMVSFGPTIEGAHSPDERVHVPSVARFWDALGRVLDRLSAPA